MSPRRLFSSILAMVVVLFGLAPAMALAQGATPAAGSATVSIANGLTNPRAFTWGADGTLYVALAGSGGGVAATEQAPTSAIIGPFTGGTTGAVAKIDKGCPVAVATGLASTLDGMGEVLGAEDVAFLGGQLYVSVDGGGPVHGNPTLASGVYKVNADGTATLVADLSAYLRANPVKTVPGDYDPDADAYRMVADEKAGVLWVLEPNSGGLLSVKADGTIARVADLSAAHPVPSAIALAPDGGVYIGMLTAVPFTDGTSKVIKVTADGKVSDVWTGLTTVTGLAVDASGVLYALELSTGNLPGPPFLVPGSGKVIKQTGPAASEDVATGLMLPISMDFGPDGGLYVSMPAIGANDGSGAIVWVAGKKLDVMTTMPVCAPIAETLSPPATPTASTPVS